MPRYGVSRARGGWLLDHGPMGTSNSRIRLLLDSNVVIAVEPFAGHVEPELLGGRSTGAAGK
jgi:hypothetical protein